MGNGPARPADYGERKPSTLCGEWTAETGQKIEIRLGDITMEDSDAIVNAANSRLSHGSGVAGAISHRGGPMIQEESDNIIKKRKKIPTGEAVVTKGYWLWAPWVIHAVGPIWSGGKKGEDEELVKAVKTSLEIAEKRKWKSIAIPAISSGIFGFPKPLCAELMFKTTIEFFEAHPKSRLRVVRFTNFDKSTVIIFQQEYIKRFGDLPEELIVKPDPEDPKKKKGAKGKGSKEGDKDKDEKDEDTSSSSEDQEEEEEEEEDGKDKKGKGKENGKGKGKGNKGEPKQEDKSEEDESDGGKKGKEDKKEKESDGDEKDSESD